MNLPKLLATLLLKAMGWKIVQDISEIPERCVAIGAPHVSWVDGLIGIGGAVILKLRMRFLVKAEIFRFPFGPLFRALGGIAVDRREGGRENRKKLTEDVVNKLNEEQKFVLVISPEGTRSKVSRWKRGFYRIASKANVPIILCYMDHVNKIGGVGKIVYPSGNMDKDMRKIMDFYAKVPQKYPDRFSIDLEYSSIKN